MPSSKLRFAAALALIFCLLSAVLVLSDAGFRAHASGIAVAIIPANVPAANKQGNSSVFQLAGTISGTGATICTDANGNTTTSGCTSGTGTAGATFFSSTTNAGPSNSAVETSLIGTVTGSTTIAANTFANGLILEARSQGFFSLPAVSDSLTLKAKCGSTVIGSASFTPAAGVVTNGTFRFWLLITAQGSGAGGVFMTNGIAELTGSALTATEAKVLNTSTVAFNFTTSCAFDMTATWGAAQSGESITGTNAAVWIPGAPVASVFASAKTGAAIPNADDISAPQFCQAAGASTTDYTCSLSPAPSAYTTGTHYRFKADVANTAAAGKPTINFNSLGATQVVKVQGAITTALVANDLRAGQWAETVYDGTNMQLVSQLGNAAGGSTFTPPYVTTDSTNFFGPIFALTKPPTIGSLTFINQGTATATSVNGEIVMKTITGTGSDDYKLLTKTACTAPCTFVIAVIFAPSVNCAIASAGIIVRDSGTKFIVMDPQSSGATGIRLRVERYLNVSSFSATQFTSQTALFGTNGPIFLSINDDNTNLNFGYSTDGVNFTQVYTEARLAFLASITTMGIAVNQECNSTTSASPTIGTFIHWTGV